MKTFRYITLALTLSGSTFILPAQAENEQDVASKIREVTVFRRGAQVTRKATVTIQKGRNELKFTELSPNIDPNSIQVKGNSKFTILSVNHRLNYLDLAASTEKQKETQRKLEDTQFDLEVVQSEMKVYAEERTMLQANQKIAGEDENLIIEDLMEMADYYRSRNKEIGYKILELQEKEKDLKKELTKLRRQLDELNYNKGVNTSEVTISMTAPARTSVQVEVSFLIAQAGWVPEYDIRSDDITGPVKLTYKGRVWQNSGYDWEKVKIKLNTGNPTQSNTQPDVFPWVLDFKVQEIYRDIAMNTAYDYDEDRVAAVEEVELEEDLNFFIPADDPTTLANYTTLVTSGVNNEFEVDIPYSIPTDGQYYTVEVKKHQLPVNYQYYTAPKFDTDAFLIAKITGWEELSLLPANAHVYYQGTYVGKSFVNTQVTTDTLEVSLGRDQGIVVTRKKIKDFSKTTTVGSSRKTTVGMEISLRNGKNKSVVVKVVDQIPISQQKEIVVNTEETSGADYDEKTGRLEWEVTLGPGESRNLELKYSVKYPKDRTIPNL